MREERPGNWLAWTQRPGLQSMEWPRWEEECGMGRETFVAEDAPEKGRVGGLHGFSSGEGGGLQPVGWAGWRCAGAHNLDILGGRRVGRQPPIGDP
jgi:hypothetical protein